MNRFILLIAPNQDNSTGRIIANPNRKLDFLLNGSAKIKFTSNESDLVKAYNEKKIDALEPYLDVMNEDITYDHHKIQIGDHRFISNIRQMYGMIVIPIEFQLDYDKVIYEDEQMFMEDDNGFIPALEYANVTESVIHYPRLCVKTSSQFKGWPSVEFGEKQSRRENRLRKPSQQFNPPRVVNG